MARDRREDKGKFFHDSTPEITGNIFTNRDRDEIQNYSKGDGEFVAFKVITNWEAGLDRDDDPRNGSTSFTVKANGAWARFILDNPDVFAFGKRVTVRGNLETEEYTYDRTVTSLDGDEVEFEETRVNNVLVIGKYGCFIAPDMRFEDNDGGGGRSGGRRSRRDEDDYDDDLDGEEGFEGDDDSEDEPPRRRRSSGRRSSGSRGQSSGGRSSSRRSRKADDDSDDSGERTSRRGGASRRRGRGNLIN